MTGGTISGNIANNGGGVFVDGGTFTMRGGVITNNIASNAGGGVQVASGTFNKTGGIITGFNSDPNDGNVVRDYAGIIARSGHAVFVNSDRRKESTAGSGLNLSNGSSAGWDN